jgi:hypothetical protein
MTIEAQQFEQVLNNIAKTTHNPKYIFREPGLHLEKKNV